MRTLLTLLGILIFAGCSGKEQPEAMPAQTLADSAITFTPDDSAPAWFNELPADTIKFFARGQARSLRLNLAVDKARLSAQADLARQLQVKYPQRYENKEVPVSGAIVLHQKKIRDGKYWKVYLVLELLDQPER
jgi:hypothetical protein